MDQTIGFIDYKKVILVDTRSSIKTRWFELNTRTGDTCQLLTQLGHNPVSGNEPKTKLIN